MMRRTRELERSLSQALKAAKLDAFENEIVWRIVTEAIKTEDGCEFEQIMRTPGKSLRRRLRSLVRITHDLNGCMSQLRLSVEGDGEAVLEWQWPANDQVLWSHDKGRRTVTETAEARDPCREPASLDSILPISSGVAINVAGIPMIIAPDSPKNADALTIAVREPPVDQCRERRVTGDLAFHDDAERRSELADAFTAILMHAEAVRRRSAKDDEAAAEIARSSEQIISAARRAWNLLES